MAGTTFLATSPPPATGAIVANDGWYPDISLDALRAETGLDGTWGDDRLRGPILAAIVAVNTALRPWRETQAAPVLAEVPGERLGDEPAALALYHRAVHCRARALILQVTRDYDTTKSGHDRADALETGIDSWMADSHEAVGRIMGRPRATVHLV